MGKKEIKKIKLPLTSGVAKVPVVMQMEALECGAASLAMVCAYYEKWIPLEQIRLDCGVSRDGANAKNLLVAARSYGFTAKGYRYEPEFSYRLTDLCDTDALYAALNKTAKKNIKAARNKTTLVEQPTAKMLMDLLDKTFGAQGRKWPHDRDLTRRIIEKSVENGHGKLLVAQDGEGNLHSGAFLLYDEKVCYYLLGGSDSAFRSSGAQSLVLWESIRFASTVSKTFDFEGSNVEGIENFFRQFGGSRVINYSVIRQSFFADCMELAKPRVKRLIGYKI